MRYYLPVVWHFCYFLIFDFERPFIFENFPTFSFNKVFLIVSHFLFVMLIVVVKSYLLCKVSTVFFVFSLFLRFVNLSCPHTWYPKARMKPRKVILHVGPTNSGKTYNALKCLESSSSGMFSLVSKRYCS